MRRLRGRRCLNSKRQQRQTQTTISGPVAAGTRVSENVSEKKIDLRHGLRQITLIVQESIKIETFYEPNKTSEPKSELLNQRTMIVRPMLSPVRHHKSACVSIKYKGSSTNQKKANLNVNRDKNSIVSSPFQKASSKRRVWKTSRVRFKSSPWHMHRGDRYIRACAN